MDIRFAHIQNYFNFKTLLCKVYEPPSLKRRHKNRKKKNC